MIEPLAPLPPFGRFIADLLAIDPETEDGGVTTLAVDLPVEFDLLAGGGEVLALGAAPPTQHIETSVLPIFHRLRVTLVAEELAVDEAEEADGDRDR